MEHVVVLYTNIIIVPQSSKDDEGASAAPSHDREDAQTVDTQRLPPERCPQDSRLVGEDGRAGGNCIKIGLPGK